MSYIRNFFDWLLLVAGCVLEAVVLGWLIGSDASRTPIQNTLAVAVLIVTPIALGLWLTGGSDE